MKDLQEQENEELSEEDRNLIGFFELLFEVDRRINPHLYNKTGADE